MGVGSNNDGSILTPAPRRWQVKTSGFFAVSRDPPAPATAAWQGRERKSLI
jgi:hypothetical protein